MFLATLDHAPIEWDPAHAKEIEDEALREAAHHLGGDASTQGEDVEIVVPGRRIHIPRLAVEECMREDILPVDQ